MTVVRVEGWELRAQLAAAQSGMYGAEVPAYTTLVDVTLAEPSSAAGATIPETPAAATKSSVSNKESS